MNPNNPDEVTVQDLQHALAHPELNIRVVDVREATEFQQGHIPGVTNLPLSVLGTGWQELDPEQITYLHCQAGVRSLKAVQLLKAHGFKQVKSVQGGFALWCKANAPKNSR